MYSCLNQGTDIGDFIPHLLDDVQLLNKAADTSVQARSPLIDIVCSLDASRHFGGVSIGCREVRNFLGSIVDLLTPRGLSASVKKTQEERGALLARRRLKPQSRCGCNMAVF